MAIGPPRRGLSPLERTLEAGIMMGMAAAVPMGLVAMVAAATDPGAGFYTPLYRIAAALDPLPLAASLQAAGEGDPFHLEVAPMLAGAAVHLAIGALFGMVFALLARQARLRGPAALGAGAAYGAALAALMGRAALPLAGDLLGGIPAIADAAAIVGWPTFVGEHLVFGLGLGAWVLLRPQDLALAPDQPDQSQETLESGWSPE